MNSNFVNLSGTLLILCLLFATLSSICILPQTVYIIFFKSLSKAVKNMWYECKWELRNRFWSGIEFLYYIQRRWTIVSIVSSLRWFPRNRSESRCQSYVSPISDIFILKTTFPVAFRADINMESLFSRNNLTTLFWKANQKKLYLIFLITMKTFAYILPIRVLSMFFAWNKIHTKIMFRFCHKILESIL